MQSLIKIENLLCKRNGVSLPSIVIGCEKKLVVFKYKIPKKPKKEIIWTEDKIKQLVKLAKTRRTGEEIAGEMCLTRDQVLGKLRRMKISIAKLK